MNKNTPSTPAAPAVAVAIGGYRVTLGRQTHFVDKSRRCSCGRPNCPAIKAVANHLRNGGRRAPAKSSPVGFPCPLCSATARGSLELRRWSCSADPRHFWAWWAARIKAARETALAQASPEVRELHRFFASDERAAFLQAHRLTYPAQG